MASEARVYQIMIASPSDVKQERDIIRKVIYEWNETNSSKEKVVLLPVGWETHGSPAVGDRAQAILNKEILEPCDLLIGVFWTRIGSSTGKAVSGTVEEINRHTDAGKPAMIYFSEKPAQLSKIDLEQYHRLKEYQKEIQGKALTESYDNTREFKDKFRRQLAHTINEHEYFQPETGNDHDALEDDTSSARETMIILSSEAIQLLRETASGDGVVLKVLSMQGMSVLANGKNFIEPNNPRSRAVWEEAVNQLENHGLIKDRSYMGEFFDITAEGYRVVDQLEKK